jgi:hypothetical protein
MTDRTALQEVAPRRHSVQFYDADSDIVTSVAGFIAAGLSRGERVVVVATATHRDAIDEVLLHYGEDAVRERVAGRYLTFDAAELLTKFMVDGRPDAGRFEAVVGGVIDAAGEDGCDVRVFGEMVSLLWQGENVAAALELESLWNSLAESREFVLMCGYPAEVLSDSLGAAHEVCSLHSEIRPPRSYAADRAGGMDDTGPTRTSEVYLPIAAAVPAARRFVLEVLRSWGETALTIDAALVASELATNAVAHAASPFRVRLHRVGSTVRIELEDVGPARPEAREAKPEDFGGRGVAIVEQVSVRWGCDVHPDHKTVWAELHRT